jgi:hypothetical protein
MLRKIEEVFTGLVFTACFIFLVSGGLQASLFYLINWGAK